MEKIKEWFYYNKAKFIVIIISIIIVCICLFFGLYYFSTKNAEIISVEKESTIQSNIETHDDDQEDVYVDIKGAVIKPGIYKINKLKRVNDVIELAGLKKDADLSVLNLSKKVFDEMVIIVYTKNETNSFLKSINETINKIEICKDKNVIVNDACIDVENISENCDLKIENNQLVNNAKKISLNNATLSELTTLSGIGESKAQTIIDYREKHKFTNIEELKDIKGIGTSIYEKIKDFITL